ncbi:MAG: glycosyltransferase family 39 protein [Candidatus Gottesmanbacteria bacterium]
MENETNNNKFRIKKLIPLIVFLGIFLLASVIRLYRIADYMTFLGDEGRDVLVVKRMIVDHKLTLLGPTASVGGFFLGPIYYYFMLPFLWLFQLDPVGPAVMVALFGIATVVLIYKVGKDMFNTKTGLTASILYSISPLVIAYSRSSWNPNLVPFFSLAFIYSLWLTVCGKWHYLFLTGVIFGIGLQLHYLFAFLLPMAIILFLIYGRNLKKIKYYLLGLLGFIVGYSPFLAFEFRHGFPNTQTVLKFIFSAKDTGFTGAKFTSIIQDVTFRLFGRLVDNYPDPGWLANMPKNEQSFYWILTIITITISLGTLLIKLVRTKDKSYVLLFLWFLSGILLFGFYKKAIYDYYLGFMFTLPFLLVGSAFSFWLHRKNTIIKLATISILCLILWVNWEGRPFRSPPNRQLAQTKEISRFVLNKTGGKPFNFALVTGQNSDHAYRYFFEIWGNKPTTIENPVIDPNRKSVTPQLLVICENITCQPLGNSLWEIAGFGRAEIEGEWDVSVVKVFKLGRYKGI